MKGVYSNVEDIEGFDVLTEDDKAKVRTAWEAEAVAVEDIPPSAVGQWHLVCRGFPDNTSSGCRGRLGGY
jgi:hypothetical protein